MRHFIATAFVVLALAACQPATAGTIINFDTVMGSFDVELYDSRTPLTAANFLAYANSGAYANTFIHRSMPGFVEQGGGYGVSGNYITLVPQQAPVVNEPGISNTRGTIAMAKLGGDPNSATSQWFFNLVDNTFLDDPSNNGGYTAFGQVLGNGMDVVDAIAALPVYDLSGFLPAFKDLPLTGPYFDANHLVMIRSVSVVTPLPGDATRNGIVDMADYVSWFGGFGKTGALWGQGDFDGDGIVDMKDYVIWFSHYGQAGSSQSASASTALGADSAGGTGASGGDGASGGSVPEPATFALLIAGAAAVLRRRRRA
ncbi:MAG: peptidylprolyl isomerase [Phycisphaerae bacterium]